MQQIHLAGVINTNAAIILTVIEFMIGMTLWLWTKFKGIPWVHNGSRVIYKKFEVQGWLWLLGILIAIWIGPIFNYGKEAPAPPPYALVCNFPQAYNRDTLYILVTRFEADANKVETACFGRALRDRIDAKANQHHIPIKICYSDSLFPKTHSEAKQFQKKYYADLVLWGDISNVEKDCSNGDFCFYSQSSDSLIRAVGGKIETETDIVKYQKDISPEKIREGNFNIKFSIKDYSFDMWLLSIYNIKIGIKNPDLYAIDESLNLDELIIQLIQRGSLYYQFNKYDKAIQDFSKVILLDSNNIRAYISRGYLKSRLENYQGAIQDFNKAILLDPKNSMSYMSRSIIKKKLGDKRGASQDFNKAFLLDPKNFYTKIAEAYSSGKALLYARRRSGLQQGDSTRH